MVDVSTAVEVDEWLQGNLRSDVFLGLRSLQLFAGGVEAVDVGLVVVLVVQLHDLARDGGLEGAIVVCDQDFSYMCKGLGMGELGIRTWEVRECSFASDEAQAGCGGSSLSSSSGSEGRACGGSAATEEGCRHY